MLRLYFNRPMLILLGLGFSSGIPFLLILSTLSFWLTEQHVSKTVLGLLMVTSLPYSLKFLWIPFVETWSIPFLTKRFGHYKSWGLMSQVLLVILIVGLGHCHPAQNLWVCAFFALMISFFSATQDIVVDAFRLSFLASDAESKKLGLSAAMESIGFRLGMLASGAGTLYLASYYTWQMAYTVTSFSILIGIISFLSVSSCETIFFSSIHKHSQKFSYLKDCWGELLKQPFFVLLAGFIFCFKISDTVLNSMSAPFLFDLGFTKLEYAQISKFFGISLMVAGGLLAGIVIHSLGLIQTIVLCLVIQTLSCFMFIIQGYGGCNLSMLTLTIGVESLGSGLAATTFIAYLSSFCHHRFHVSYFTFLYSLGSFSRVFVSTLAGWIADVSGWTILFSLTSLSFFPSLYLLLKIHRRQQGEDKKNFIFTPLQRKRT